MRVGFSAGLMVPINCNSVAPTFFKRIADRFFYLSI